MVTYALDHVGAPVVDCLLPAAESGQRVMAQFSAPDDEIIRRRNGNMRICNACPYVCAIREPSPVEVDYTRVGEVIKDIDGMVPDIVVTGVIVVSRALHLHYDEWETEHYDDDCHRQDMHCCSTCDPSSSQWLWELRGFS